MIRRILFQGDSITDVNRSKDVVPNFMMGGGYATMTAGRLSADHPELGLEFMNRGISGNRVSDLYARWKVDAINLRPDLITILIGINDVWHEVDQSNGVDTERFEEVYRMLLKWTLRDLPEVRLVLLEPFYPMHGVVAQETWAPYISDIDAKRAVGRRIADEFGAAL
ncbi:MAG: SGNH/GDSL hydrolase family protein, partial [Victivallaceae bacterium]|nr:SGNH/GDSL hydrolase family protein [Victivallaceae bacterium]